MIVTSATSSIWLLLFIIFYSFNDRRYTFHSFVSLVIHSFNYFGKKKGKKEKSPEAINIQFTQSEIKSNNVYLIGPNIHKTLGNYN